MITAHTLKDDRQLYRLYRGAVSKGMIKFGPHTLNEYICAAEYALAKAKPGMEGNAFVSIVMNKKWHLITDEIEQVARARLKRMNGIKPRPKTTGKSIVDDTERHRRMVNRLIYQYRSGYPTDAKPETPDMAQNQNHIPGVTQRTTGTIAPNLGQPRREGGS